MEVPLLRCFHPLYVNRNEVYMNTNIVRLKCNSVSLGVFRFDDYAIEKYMSWYNDEENLVALGINDDIFDYGDIERLKNGANSTNQKMFNIIHNEDGELIGVCSISMDYHRLNGELEILIGEKAYRGYAIGGEVINALKKYCFEELRLHRLEINVLANNSRAIRCYEKCGFVQCGVMHEKVFSGGVYLDVIAMEVLKN